MSEYILASAEARRIQADLEALSAYNATPGEGITRILFTPEELDGREFIKGRMMELGLLVREDAAGNIFGALKGEDDSLEPVWTGSHIDTVPNGGMFDGTVGVIGALEAVRVIKESGAKRERTIEIVVFTSEEPSRFGKGCIGSRALCGEMSLEDTKGLVGGDGKSFYELLDELGYLKFGFDNVRRTRGDVHAFLELHIEQGAVLEEKGVPIGIVSTICAPTDIHMDITGVQAHAGATPMAMRHDAFAAACAASLKLEELARASENKNTVATVGKINVRPGASNVIPGKVDFTIDIRSSSLKSKDDLLKSFKEFVESEFKKRGVVYSMEELCHDKPRDAEPKIISALESSCQQLDYPYHGMVSGAYHDAMMVAEFAPFGMIFVPSKGGISHDRQEWTDFKDIAKGVDVLAHSLLTICNE